MLRLQLAASDILDAALKLLASKLDALPEPFEREYLPEGGLACQSIASRDFTVTSNQAYSIPDQLDAILDEPMNDIVVLLTAVVADERAKHPGMALKLLTADVGPAPAGWQAKDAAMAHRDGIAARLMRLYDIRQDAYINRFTVRFSLSLG